MMRANEAREKATVHRLNVCDEALQTVLRAVERAVDAGGYFTDVSFLDPPSFPRHWLEKALDDLGYVTKWPLPTTLRVEW